MRGPPHRDVIASVLLVVSYPTALAMLARLRPVLAERRVWWFVTLEGATAGIVVGWSLLGRLVPVLVNGAALIGFAFAWLITGRHHGRPGRDDAFRE